MTHDCSQSKATASDLYSKGALAEFSQLAAGYVGGLWVQQGNRPTETAENWKGTSGFSIAGLTVWNTLRSKIRRSPLTVSVTSIACKRSNTNTQSPQLLY